MYIYIYIYMSIYHMHKNIYTSHHIIHIRHLHFRMWLWGLTMTWVRVLLSKRLTPMTTPSWWGGDPQSGTPGQARDSPNLHLSKHHHQNNIIRETKTNSWRAPKRWALEKVDSGLKYGHFLVCMLDFWGVTTTTTTTTIILRKKTRIFCQKISLCRIATKTRACPQHTQHMLYYLLSTTASHQRLGSRGVLRRPFLEWTDW